MITTTELLLDISRNTTPPIVYAKQGDKNSRSVSITLLENGKPYTLGNNITARIKALKPDDKAVFNNATILENKIIVELTEQTLAEPGLVIADISLYDDNSILSTHYFYIRVERSALSDKSIVSTDEFTVLTDALSETTRALATAIMANDKATSLINELGDFSSAVNEAKESALTSTQNAETATEKAQELSNAVQQVAQNTADLENKLNKPSEDGTPGQILTLDKNNNPQWQNAMTEIKDGTVTPEKTSFFTKSDIEYEIVEGQKLNANNIVADDNAFTVFIKIPDKPFAWISVTPSNTTYPFGSGTRTAGSLICDTSKKALGSYGFTDNNRNLCVLRGDKVSDYDGAAYFAVSYTIGTEFNIKIGGIGVCNNIEIPISNTELGTDFIVSGKNLISDTDTKVIYSSSNDRWSWQGSSSHNITNFFEVKNNTAYYHNGRYVYIDLFDEHYNHVGSVGNHNSGDIIQKDYNFKYAYAYSTTSTGIPTDFWFADTDLARRNKSANLINPDYIDLSNIKRMQIKNWYNGKRVSFMGDSLTEGGTGGFYINYLNDYFGFANIKKSAKGGTMVSGVTTAMGSAFWEDSRVNQLDIDSDVVFIMGGTNDANNNVTLGSPDISNCNTNTFYGAYHVLISKLIYKYYKLDTGYYADIDYSGVTQAETAKPVQIFLITPPYMLSSESQYNKTPAYCEAVIDIGKQLGCPVCDIRANSGVNIFAKEYYKGYRNGNFDYVHVSPEAHEQWTKVIIGKMLETEPIGSEEN